MFQFSGPTEPIPGLWEDWMTVTVAVGVLVAISLFVIILLTWRRQRHQRLRPHYNCEDSTEAPDLPILGGVSLKSMIEMTTSGSGSGMLN